MQSQVADARLQHYMSHLFWEPQREQRRLIDTDCRRRRGCKPADFLLKSPVVYKMNSSVLVRAVCRF